MANVKVMYENIEVGTVLTNRSLTVDEALELIGFDEAAFCEAHGFDGVDPADFRIEYESIEKIEIRVKNAGFYGENESGTWEELREAIAEQVPGWHECDVTKHSYIGGKKHYWGDLLDEERNVVYTFYAVFDAKEGEVEVQKA